MRAERDAREPPAPEILDTSHLHGNAAVRRQRGKIRAKPDEPHRRF